MPVVAKHDEQALTSCPRATPLETTHRVWRHRWPGCVRPPQSAVATSPFYVISHDARTLRTAL